MQIIIALVSGIVFGLGLAISGMINPAKVLNFFDVFGSFDPSLALVMAGALPVTFIGALMVRLLCSTTLSMRQPYRGNAL